MRKGILLSVLGTFFGMGAAGAAEKVAYNRDVRPILSENCFFCHGPDKAHRKAGLRLDLRDAAVEDGAFVPGDPDGSELYKRIVTRDADDLMPPGSTHKTLSAQQIDTLRRWIAEGAEYQPHWAYVKITRPSVPVTASARSTDNPIDRFVDATLAAKGLSPSTPASPATLLRRLSLDLVGLPPTPEALASFTKRAGENFQKAYHEELMRLLASPHYGERMAVPWLDVVRYADTVGYHGDQNQNVFPYRDYVIAAFNSNKRFDVFTTEQIAGDLLPNATVEQKIATGFNRLNMVTREGGAQPKEYLAKYMGDRVRAIGTAFLGSTLGCAECHDHKYDPILTRDFYSMGAFFADIREWGVYADYEYTPLPELPGLNNDDPFPPELLVDNPAEKARAKMLRAQITASNEAILKSAFQSPRARQGFTDWMSEARTFLKTYPTGAWTLTPTPAQISNNDDRVRVEAQGDKVVLHGKSGRTSTTIAIDRDTLGKGLGRIASVRIALVPTDTHKGSILREDNKNDYISIGFKVVRADSEDGSRKETKINVRTSNVDDPVLTYQNGFPRFNVNGSWVVGKRHLLKQQVAEFEFTEPVTLAQGDVLKIIVSCDDLGAFRVSLSPFASQTSLNVPSITRAPVDSPAGWPAFMRKALARPSGAALRGLQEIYIRSTNIDSVALEKIDTLARELLLTRDGRVPTLVTESQAPRPVRILPRGNWQDETGPLVDPAPPSFLPGWDAIRPADRPTRLHLARWLTSRDNPLTARTFMNRLWRQYFGVGLSSVLDDLGAQGETPSHPELLDWLSAEFMESGWNVKHMVELIVTSRAYQQSSHMPASLRSLDPDNRLLARQSQRRLDAEFVRDNALAVAGLINTQMGGAPVKPYQPDGYYENLEFPQRTYEPSPDARQWRRGLYTHWQRTFVHPMMANFDAPSREECTANRPGSNTPQQALTLLNDPTFVEAARALAARSLQQKAGATDAERIAFAFERATGRAPIEAERVSLQSLLTEQRQYFTAHQDAALALVGVGISPKAALDPVEHAAWTSVARVILNLYETVTRL